MLPEMAGAAKWVGKTVLLPEGLGRSRRTNLGAPNLGSVDSWRLIVPIWFPIESRDPQDALRGRLVTAMSGGCQGPARRQLPGAPANSLQEVPLQRDLSNTTDAGAAVRLQVSICSQISRASGTVTHFKGSPPVCPHGVVRRKTYL